MAGSRWTNFEVSVFFGVAGSGYLNWSQHEIFYVVTDCFSAFMLGIHVSNLYAKKFFLGVAGSRWSNYQVRDYF